MKPKQLKRPGWDAYFMSIAHVVATRGNCIRRQVAAIIVKEHRIVSTGYNGTPKGIRNCCEGGCPRCAGKSPSGANLGECICSHAEENAITQASYHGISINGATLYCTMSPCLICAKMIINSGIKKVIYEQEYQFSRQTKRLFAEAGIVCRRYGSKGASSRHTL
jgi:dCMP deaminase